MSGTLESSKAELRVGIGSLGSIGLEVARALDRGIPGLRLYAVSAKHVEKASQRLEAFHSKPRIVELAALAQLADVVVECAPAAVYDQIANPAIDAGRTFLTMSSGALLSRPQLIERAKQTGARIIVPSGGILGLDALKAAAEGDIYSVTLVTRKPPSSLSGAPYLVSMDISLSGLAEATRVFQGTALQAALAFPANANVAATLSLAGIEAKTIQVEIWADPTISQNIQQLRVRSSAADFQLELASHPLSTNPRTGSLTPRSLIATLRALRSNMMVGT